jgi:TnpA family transposase
MQLSNWFRKANPLLELAQLVIYTDTAGFTDHVFGAMPFFGFRFAPRIRDLGETKHYISKGSTVYEGLKPMISNERQKLSRYATIGMKYQASSDRSIRAR